MEIELSSLYGLEMYTDKGVRVGEIENVSVDIKEKRVAGLAVKNINPNVFAFDLSSEGRWRGVIVPYRWVTAIGDIVLIKHVKRRVGAAERGEAERGEAERGEGEEEEREEQRQR